MDLLKVAREIFDGFVEAARKYLELLLAILVIGVLIAAAYLGLDLVKEALGFAIDLIGSVQGLIN